MFCPGCGREIAPEARFCEGCGTKLGGAPGIPPGVPAMSARPVNPVPPPAMSPRAPVSAPPAYGSPRLQSPPVATIPRAAPVSAPAPVAPQPIPPPRLAAPAPASYASPANNREIPDRLRPMSTGQYLLMFLLLAIPLLNFLLLLVWSFSSTTNVNKQNLSRAILISAILSAIAWIGVMYLVYRGQGGAAFGLRLPM